MQVSHLVLSVIVALISISCGGGAGLPVSLAPMVAKTEPNLIVRTRYFGSEGNLYKPVRTSHGSDNLLVKLGSQFTTAFDRCELPLADGTTAPLLRIDAGESMNTAHGDSHAGKRPAWRASYRCSSIAEIKVTCRSLTQEVVFTVPEESRGNVCTRFG